MLERTRTDQRSTKLWGPPFNEAFIQPTPKEKPATIQFSCARFYSGHVCTRISTKQSFLCVPLDVYVRFICIGSFLSKQLCCPMWALAIMWSEASCVYMYVLVQVYVRFNQTAGLVLTKLTCFYRDIPKHVCEAKLPVRAFIGTQPNHLLRCLASIVLDSCVYSSTPQPNEIPNLCCVLYSIPNLCCVLSSI